MVTIVGTKLINHVNYWGCVINGEIGDVSDFELIDDWWVNKKDSNIKFEELKWRS